MPAQALAPLRLAIIGCGAVAERYHLPALQGCGDITVVAVVDPSPDRARLLSARLPGSVALSDHRELTRQIDAAVVTAPNAWHEAISVDLLRDGIHVLVEKPMARSVDECDRMAAAASASGCVLAVGQDFRHFPVAQFAAGFFAERPFGPIRSVDVRQNAGTRWPSVSTGEISREGGGGVLINFGVHILDLLLWWLGDIRAVAYRDDANGGVEAECECDLELDDGVPVRVQLTRRRPMRDTVVARCEGGTIELGIFEPAVVRLRVGVSGRLLEAAVPDAEFERAPLRTVFARQLADFVAAIRDGRDALVPASAGRRVVALISACYARREPLRRPWDYPEAFDQAAKDRR
jgi:predicted dehydrogenase